MTVQDAALFQRLIDDLTEARATAAAAVERLSWLEAALPSAASLTPPKSPVMRLLRSAD